MGAKQGSWSYDHVPCLFGKGASKIYNHLGTIISYERIYSHQKRMGYQPEQGPEGNFLVEFVCGGSLHDSLSGDDGNCIIVFFFSHRQLPEVAVISLQLRTSSFNLSRFCFYLVGDVDKIILTFVGLT